MRFFRNAANDGQLSAFLSGDQMADPIERMVNMRVGLDVGSTTLKCVVMNDENEILFKKYERHLSRIVEKSAEMLREVDALFPEAKIQLSISGSAGMGLAERSGIQFVQEVYATRIAVNRIVPGTDTVIELGGEDAKILFLTDGNNASGLEVRMNGSCAGGTGAFIDQMATLLNITPDELNTLAKDHEKIYTIASRCGVFAKSDIQPLLNQGAQKKDVAASILYAVVNQTVAGLAQGREIAGKVVYLGGPMTFLSQLRAAFDDTLKITGICPENSLYFVAMGAAFAADGEEKPLKELIGSITNYTAKEEYRACPPLFKSEAEYKEFSERHSSAGVETRDTVEDDEPVFIGIDAGSTTVKAVVIDKDGKIICSKYMSNSGNPVPLVREFLLSVYERFPKARISACASTGYGEDIIKNAFSVDYGIVETMAHFYAARSFNPKVDFIIDIGGQDIKCFKIHNGVIDDIFLNEACSSGCGSFLQTFAGALGYAIEDFAKLGLFAERPVDLGSRCTVFMNSSVKQAQKDGATVDSISAGLSISVVKNALYKVIRAVDSKAIGREIVVQGGTFLNDAVLRAFEQEIGRNVIRPTIAGLMGAYGAALYARDKAAQKGFERSSLLGEDELKDFTHSVRAITCHGCSNNCKLTVNTFSGDRRFISGNRCEKPVSGVKSTEEKYNMFEEKRRILSRYSYKNTGKPVIGIPMGLNMYELLPFWHKFFTTLGYDVKTSPASNRALYLKGQHTIPSDTACFPAKLMHGHVEALIESGVDAIFYPCMSYNLDEGLGDNHYNCPVVAYYPEVISANIKALKDTVFIGDYVGIHRRKDFPGKMTDILNKHFARSFTKKEVKAAADAAYAEYELYMRAVRAIGEKYLNIAREQNKPIVVLAGRPYHIDPEINHGIDSLICDCGAVLVTEDAVSDKVKRFPTTVLNQWTYHSRLYAAAKYVSEQDKMINLIQLVSFGCGVDAITTDEVRGILQGGGKIYTQLKIDEITNLGAVRIRLRSLFSALDLM